MREYRGDASGLLHLESGISQAIEVDHAIWFAPLDGRRLVRFQDHGWRGGGLTVFGWLSEDKFFFANHGVLDDPGPIMVGDIATGEIDPELEDAASYSFERFTIGSISIVLVAVFSPQEEFSTQWTLLSLDGGEVKWIAPLDRYASVEVSIVLDRGNDSSFIVDSRAGLMRVVPALLSGKDPRLVSLDSPSVPQFSRFRFASASPDANWLAVVRKIGKYVETL